MRRFIRTYDPDNEDEGKAPTVPIDVITNKTYLQVRFGPHQPQQHLHIERVDNGFRVFVHHTGPGDDGQFCFTVYDNKTIVITDEMHGGIVAKARDTCEPPCGVIIVGPLVDQLRDWADSLERNWRSAPPDVSMITGIVAGMREVAADLET